jgi:SM-20-related protein
VSSAKLVVQEKIIDAIAVTGYYVGESFLTLETTAGLRQALLHRHRLPSTAMGLRPARISQASSLVPEWRGDAIAWLSATPRNHAEGQAIVAINALRLAFNAAFFTALKQTQLHYARYPIGAFYKRHVDRFFDPFPAVVMRTGEPTQHRVISLVFYLNDHWAMADGGELVLYDGADQMLSKVPPRSGTMVAFRSEQFPHEVLPAIKPRLSLTGWMLAAL